MFPQGLLPLLSHTGTQRLLKPQSKAVQILLELVANFGIIHMLLVCRHQNAGSVGSWRLPSTLQKKDGELRQGWQDRSPCEELLRSQCMKWCG
jgi:hypothetical protein